MHLSRRHAIAAALAFGFSSSSAPARGDAVALVLSDRLKNPKLRSPLPGGVMAGYAGDTGLDIGGASLSVHAIADGTLDYAERGHTRWTGPRDTAMSVRLALDEPIPWGKHRVTHVYYTHMARLDLQKAEGEAKVIRVAAGQRLGTSGTANGIPHLHLGLLCDGQVEQDSWEFILRENEVRKLLGGYANGERLAPLVARTT